MMDWHPWVIVDSRTGRRQSIAVFSTERMAWEQIRQWQMRQRKGGRPDVDATYLEPRLLEEMHDER